MIQSMTAFARAQRQVDEYMVCWELRTVNHRFLDISIRLPELYRTLEMDLRQLLRQQLHRGKVECQLNVRYAVDTDYLIQINKELISAFLDMGDKLASRYQIANDLTVSKVLAWPGIADGPPPDTTAVSFAVQQLFKEGLDELVASRLSEGNLLKKQINSRLQHLITIIGDARKEADFSASQTREKLIDRLNGLQIDVSDFRLEQEIAMVLLKLDVSEELDRLEAHLSEVSRVLDCDKVAGRRLDFLMQELNREANTLSAKSDSVALTQHTVEMKVLIEQMREQIQNIE